MLYHYGVHFFMAAHNGINWAGFDAAGAAYAPGFINNGYAQWRFTAAVRLKLQRIGQSWLAQCCGNARNASNATWRAAVDVSLLLNYGLRVAGAVSPAAALALGLWQQVVDFFRFFGQVCV